MTFKLRGKVIFFATNNVNKFNEACKALTKYRIAVGMLRVKTLEIQSESLEEIARTSALYAFRECGLPIIVEDAGLFIEALNGFPGPYAAYIYRTLGNKGLLQLMKSVENRRAEFHSVVAYYAKDCEFPLCFDGKVFGEITMKERKGDHRSGFGFDPVFKPVNCNKTFAEMSVAEKNSCSHRANALCQFAEWYKKFQ